MQPRRPEVFISTTSGDLRSCRQMIKEALLTLGCVPVEQTNFPPDYRSVREMLRVKIAACDAVVHLAGDHYGAEPGVRAAGEPRRSYTQLEYDLARELKKPLYVFVCGDDFAYDPHPPEDAEKRGLQQAHRAALLGGETLRYKVQTRDELALKIQGLQTTVEHLAGELRKSRSHLGRGVTIGLLALFGLGAGVWWANERAGKTETRVAQLETELDKQRRYIKAVADVYSAQQSQQAELKLTDEQKFARALKTVADKEGLAPTQLQAAMNLFAAAIRGNPAADFLDRALAEFAQRDFASAATNAGAAAARAREERLAAETISTQAAVQADAARERERAALRLQGQAFHAADKYAEAAASFRQALELTPRATRPGEWAELQHLLGSSCELWADRSEGAAIADLRRRALDAYESALLVRTRDQRPWEWAQTQNSIAGILRDQALDASDDAVERLFAASIAGYRSVLAVYTRGAAPDLWADTQHDLANALGDWAEHAEPARQAKLFGEAFAAFDAVEEIITRTYDADGWARLRRNRGATLIAKSATVSAVEQVALLGQADHLLQEAGEIHTREKFPENWATLQHTRAMLGITRGEFLAGPQREALLADATERLRASQSIYTRETWPQEWANHHQALGALLLLRAETAAPEERAALCRDAQAEFAEALRVMSRSHLPNDWALVQVGLGNALRLQSLTSDDPKASRERAAAALREALTIFDEKRAPLRWAVAQLNLAATLVELAANEPEPAGAAKFLGEAEAASHGALRVFTPENGAPLWMRCQLNLAMVAVVASTAAPDPEVARRRLGEAVAATSRVIERTTRDENPREWALAQLNLGFATGMLAMNDAPGFTFARAGECLELSLQVLTREESPVEWARSVFLSGMFAFARAEKLEGPEQGAALRTAVRWLREAAEVFTPEAFPADGARVRMFLGLALKLQIGREGAAGDSRLRDEARQHLAAARKFFAAAGHADLARELAENMQELGPLK